MCKKAYGPKENKKKINMFFFFETNIKTRTARYEIDIEVSGCPVFGGKADFIGRIWRLISNYFRLARSKPLRHHSNLLKVLKINMNEITYHPRKSKQEIMHSIGMFGSCPPVIKALHFSRLQAIRTLVAH